MDQQSSNESSSSLYRRLAQTESDVELIPNPPSESAIHASVLETQISAEELRDKAKVKSNFRSFEIKENSLDCRAKNR